MLDKLKNKLKEISDISQSVIEDKLDRAKVPPEIQQARFNICLDCDKLYKPSSTCKVCGCFMKVKTWMPNQRCPLGKWEKHKI